MAIIEIKNLTFFYPQAENAALDNLSLNIDEGDFFALCGPSGSGKSTLLRHLKPQLAPQGKMTGEIFFNNKNINDINDKESASEICFVQQSPENQIVTDKVWHELSFGLESLGCDNKTIRLRVAEMASFFGIENWFYKNVSELSGGQKQILNLASVMVMQPKVLILDEPTSQLDPIAATEFLETLKKINSEIGTTIILSEHRLQEAIPLANKVGFINKGKTFAVGSAQEVAERLKENNSGMFLAMPTAMQVWASTESKRETPVSVNEGKTFLKEYVKDINLKDVEKKTSENNNDVALKAEGLYFKYDKHLSDVLKNTDITLKKGEFYCLLGGNGTGKSTFLKVLSGCEKAYRGKVTANGKISMLPQNPETLFLKNSVYDDLEEVAERLNLSKEDINEKINNVINLCDLGEIVYRHPFDLSGGEKQRAALAKLLLTEPDILFLDEPTKGLDVEFKIQFGNIIESFLKSGVAVLMVSHDIEFCAKYAHRCGLFFDGNIVTENEPQEFFNNNSFYTTSASRMAKGIVDNAVLTEDIIYAIGGKSFEFLKPKKDIKVYSKKFESPKDKEKKLPLWRKICGGVTALSALILFIYTSFKGTLSEGVDGGAITKIGEEQLLIYGVFILLLLLTGFFITKKSNSNIEIEKRQKLSKRTKASVFIIILLIPITLFLGLEFLDVKQYYVTSLLVLLECMIPFFMVFEGRKPKARELVTIAVLCALAIAGRAAFYMVPQFKPVIAITIIAGVALGGETGFLVGAVTMLCSNILFAQGPWTPFQMFAAGIIGFLAGVLYRKGLLQRSRTSLCVFGAITTLVIYGGIMNPTTALVWGGEALNLKMLLGYYVTGFPMDLIHAFATFIFLWFLSEPMLQKLDRIKVKYSLIE